MSIELDGFLAQIRELSDNSYNFGNEILYKMAKNRNDLTNEEKLIGSLWLIGRSYSASPERRNYKGEWIPRPANDGRGNFFSEIAKSLSDSECFGELIEAYNSENCTYTFASQENRAINDNDKNLLVKAIRAVISFNSDLSKAIQEFDRVPDEYTNKFDPDSVLYGLIKDMRNHDFSKKQISRFASEWMRAMEQTDNASHMRMYAYLFDEFSHATYPPESRYKLVYDIIPLNGLKSFERALEFIPKWVEYMNSYDQYVYGHTPDRCVPPVIEKMRECGYTDTEVEEFSARVIASMPTTSPDLNGFEGSSF